MEAAESTRVCFPFFVMQKPSRADAPVKCHAQGAGCCSGQFSPCATLSWERNHWMMDYHSIHGHDISSFSTPDTRRLSARNPKWQVLISQQIVCQRCPHHKFLMA